MDWYYLDKDKLIGNCKKLTLKPIDIKKIITEIDTITGDQWNTQFRSKIHQDTQSIFLRGHPPIDNIPEDSDRNILSQLPYIKHFIHHELPGVPRKCLIAKLLPQGVIKLHEDGSKQRNPKSGLIYDYFKSTIRLHIPIVSNENVAFYIKNQFYNMPVGEAWAINNLSTHGVINNNTDLVRIHIIVDIIPNLSQQQFIQSCEEPTGWFNQAAYDHVAN